MSMLLPSTCRSRRTLPPHGYEGRRAEARPFPGTKPGFVSRLPELPSAEELTRLGITFEPVGVSPGPVRARQHGFALGVFINQQAAAGLILRLNQS